MLRSRLLVVLSLLLIGTLVLAACASAPTPPEEAEGEAEATPEEQVGETTEEGETAPSASDTPYRLGVFEDITTTNYWAYLGPSTSAWTGYVLGPQSATLYGLADQTFALVPSVAEGMPERPLTQEGEFYLADVMLKEGVTWSDGTPLTANDVAFTANTSLELQLPGNWASFIDPNFVDRVEAVDDTTVRYYYTEEPGLAVHEYGTLTAPILSEAYWSPLVEEAREAVGTLSPPAEDAPEEEQAAYQERLNEALNVLLSHEPEGEPTLGAFSFGSWERGAFAENETNPDYYGQGAEIAVYADGAYEEIKEGAYETRVGDPVSEKLVEYTRGPFIPAMIYTIYSDQNAALLALQDGEIDFLLNPSGLQQGLRAQVEGQEGINVIENPVNGFRYLSFNTRREPMDDTAFRQAVAVLIDKEYVTEQILQGAAYPLYSVVPEGNAFWYTDDVTKYGLSEDGASLTREERVAQAISILEEAGYSWENDEKPTWDEENRQVITGGTLVLPSGETMSELELLAPGPGYDPLRSTFAIWIEQYLSEFGIPVTANLTGFNIILEQATNQQDFDMFMLGWGVTTFPDYVRDFFHSDRAGIGDFNSGGFSNPEFDELADGIKTCTTFDECQEISVEIQQVLAEELPYVLLFGTSIVEVYNDNIQFPYTETLDGIQNWYGLPSSVVIE